MQDLYCENYKILLGLLNGKTWIGRLNIVKMAGLPKVIHKFNIIPIKIPTNIFREMAKMTLKFIQKCKAPRIVKISGENKFGNVTHPTFKNLSTR